MEENSEQPSSHLGFLRRVYNYRGFIFAFAAASFYALTAITVSALSNDISPTMIVFVRMVMSLFLTSAVLCYKGIPIRPFSKKEFLFHCLNSVVTLSIICMQYYTWHHMATADACAITNSYIVFAGLFGRLFLKEVFGLLEALMVLLTIMGVVLVSRPLFIFGLTDLDEGEEIKGGFKFVPPLVAVACAISMALLLVVQRTMGKQNIHVMKTVFYNATLSCRPNNSLRAMDITRYLHS
ncbi:Solute carrier family 35 member G1 [Holothuria leucospilota]|uniref:Solute carrier family 35 member G1 n=1 Tax=Holothuria leucospilota TaxID=206669 RepID=A0A9Q1B9U4_HOLLE|nr:Solute carrier family 35 member G1 [Holothuria leucospilota]